VTNTLGKRVDGSNHEVIYGTTPTFAWSVWVKSLKTPVTAAYARRLPTTQSVTAWTNVAAVTRLSLNAPP